MEPAILIFLKDDTIFPKDVGHSLRNRKRPFPAEKAIRKGV
jgi:hypothetical protein